jgi:uncharacterized protein (DUF433 family)
VRALFEVLTRTPRVRSGAAVFSGTKVPVKLLIDHLDRGGSVDDFVARFPQVSHDLALAACALGLEALVAKVPLESVAVQASLLPRVDGAGVVINAEELAARQVVGKRVRCPACRSLVFRSWPEGWDSHAAKRCRGVRGKDESSRKAEFKRRFEHLFKT